MSLDRYDCGRKHLLVLEASPRSSINEIILTRGSAHSEVARDTIGPTTHCAYSRWMYCIVRLNTFKMNHQYAADIGVRAVGQAQMNKYVGAQCFNPSVSTELMQVLQQKALLCLDGSVQQLFWAS